MVRGEGLGACRYAGRGRVGRRALARSALPRRRGLIGVARDVPLEAEAGAVVAGMRRDRRRAGAGEVEGGVERERLLLVFRGGQLLLEEGTRSAS